MLKLKEKPSDLKREHPALFLMKILSFFLFFGVIFALLDPDPDPHLYADPDLDQKPQINADPSGSGYGSGSETLVCLTH
jgi:hypothetical protein